MQASEAYITAIIIASTLILLSLSTFIVGFAVLHFKRISGFHESMKALQLNFEKNILKTKVEIQEQTLLNVTREIHDNINLALILAKLHLSTVDLSKEEDVQTTIESSVRILSKAVNDLSDLSRSMNPEVIKNSGFMNVLDCELKKITLNTKLLIRQNVSGEPVFMEAEKELVVIRIIQEALNNILKHSKATLINLYFNYMETNLEVRVKDNGVGFALEDIKNRKGTIMAGLINMETRAKLFGGTFQIQSCPSQGTEIYVSIPY
jgi:signal transduction histidine kinase